MKVQHKITWWKMKTKGKSKNKGENRSRLNWLLELIDKNSKYKRAIDIFILIFGGVAQFVFKTQIVNFLGIERCDYLRKLSLMLGMASTIGLSTVVVFGFNLGKSVQQFRKEMIKKHGLGNLKGIIMPEVNINYWQLILLVLLYICIVADWCTLFYILLIYDVISYIVLLLKLWLIENIEDEYLIYRYEREDEEGKKGVLGEVLQSCVESNGQVNMCAVKTYLELLYIFLEENDDEIETRFNVESFYDKVKSLFNDTMKNLLLDRKVQSFLLLSVIRKLCNMQEKNIGELRNQILLSVMIEYALDGEKNIALDLIYRELTNWSDRSLGLRHCIAVTRVEYLYIINQKRNKIFLSKELFYLYRPIMLEPTYERLVNTLWYLWCREDGESFLVRIKNLDNFIDLYQNDFKIYRVTAAGDSLCMLVKGLRY